MELHRLRDAPGGDRAGRGGPERATAADGGGDRAGPVGGGTGRASVETLRSLDDEPRGGPFDLILLDLQALAGDPAVLVSRVAAINEKQRAQTDKSAKLIAFGPHVAKERLAESVAAGADAAVSRGELLGGFHGLVKRWLA